MPKNEEVIQQYKEAARRHDVPALVEMFTDDAVLLFGTKPVVGKEAIRTLFETLPMSPETHTDMGATVSHGEYVFLTYRLGDLHGGDTFHIRDGRIKMQSAHIARLAT